jgi:hypothetical protein
MLRQEMLNAAGDEREVLKGKWKGITWKLTCWSVHRMFDIDMSEDVLQLTATQDVGAWQEPPPSAKEFVPYSLVSAEFGSVRPEGGRAGDNLGGARDRLGPRGGMEDNVSMMW